MVPIQLISDSALGRLPPHSRRMRHIVLEAETGNGELVEFADAYFQTTSHHPAIVSCQNSEFFHVLLRKKVSPLLLCRYC